MPAGWHMAQPETVAAFEDSVAKLARSGANVREVTLPAAFAELTGARERINDYERARGLAHEWQYHRENQRAPAAEHGAWIRACA